MRLICLWCAVVGMVMSEEDFYAPQTFRQTTATMFRAADTPGAASQRNAEVVEPYYSGAGTAGGQLFRPAPDVAAQGTSAPTSWKTSPAPRYDDYYRGPEERRPEPWRLPYGISKEQQASILHHKQSLSSEGAFRFEYASDNGLAAGEVIEPDGSRVGAYQYKDPSGQLVKLKYRAGKGGFQILEGSHLPKSPEPVAPAPQTDDYYTTAYDQQQRQYQLQQQYNQQRPEPKQWQQQERESEGARYYNNLAADGRNDGQYRDNSLEEQNRGPHSFGEGYAFAFKG